MGDSEIRVDGLDKPAQVLEMLRYRLGITPGEASVSVRVHRVHLTAESSEQWWGRETPSPMCRVECDCQLCGLNRRPINCFEDTLDIRLATVLDRPLGPDGIPRSGRCWPIDHRRFNLL